MFVTVTCRACGLKFKVQSRFAGRLGSCPRAECGRKFLVPATDEAGDAATPGAGQTANASPAAAAPSPATKRSSTATLERTERRSRPAAPAKEEDVDWLYQHAGVERDAPPSASPRTSAAKAKPASSASTPSAARSTAARRTQGRPPQRPGIVPRISDFARSSPGRFAGVAGLVLLGVLGLIAGSAAMFGGGAEEKQTADAPEPEREKAAKADAANRENAALFTAHVAPYLKNYCVDCHAGDQAEAGVVLDSFTTEDKARKDRKTWEKVARMIEADAMPPADHAARPKPAETKQLVAWLDARVFHVECELPPDPGRVTVRRLNRNEYNNTIRDLVGVDFRPADDFPSDDVGNGFDNIGDVLSLPPLLMEKYLDAAEKIAAAAVVVRDPKGVAQTVPAEKLTRDEQFRVTDDEFISLVSAGEVSTYFEFPTAGEYVLKLDAKADQAGPEPAKLEVRFGGKLLQTIEIKGNRKSEAYEVKFTAEKGKHRVEVAFTNDYYMPKAKNPRDRDRNAYVGALTLQGPIGATAKDLPPTHAKIVIARPGDVRAGDAGSGSKEGLSLRDAAKEVLKPFARRAFRRPVTEDEIEPFVRLVEFAAKQGDSYERGLQVALQGILCSPHFLFRIERDANPHDPAAKHPVSEHELASRLSYFLWSSMPDEELLRLADDGKLRGSLEPQVRRMLADPKSAALVENFGGQWLNLRNLDEVTPDPNLFPEFTPELRADMKKETELFVASLIREDRSILEVLDAKHTFLNDRLAKHYGFALPDAKPGEFQKVTLADTRRGGVLTQASILTLTSDPNKTSPVKRGKWILENILGTPPPPPPPNVPEFDVVKKANPKATLREQLALHRTNATCASCHKVMDPLGLGFENFDPLGRWRDKDGDHAIDPSGSLPGGETFQGPAELRAILKGREKQFVKHFTKQLLTYALGRGLEDSDQCSTDAMVETASKESYRVSTLVMEVVRSGPFLMRRGEK